MGVIGLLLAPLLIFAQQQKTPSASKRKIPVPHAPLRPMLPSLDRSQPDKVFLEYADRLYYDEIPGLPKEEQPQILVGNVKLRKGGMWMYCDSAYFFERTSSFDAFGNVRMDQGDTLHVYADELNYNGPEQLAILFADPGKKVKLINRDVTLETDIFNYDLATDIGYYNIGGKLTDRQNVLTSVEGQYQPRTKQAYFNYDVHLESQQKNDKLTINTEALYYNTATHIAELNSPSEIINSDGTIYTSRGIYNTDNGLADLFSRSRVRTNKGNILMGDTLFYDRNKQYGEAFGNMIMIDSARQSSILGNYGFYDEVRDSAFVTGRALAKEYSKGDTLYLHGDTILTYLDLVDSTRVTNAFHNVRIFRFDIQAICDSLSLTERDSIMHLYRHPVAWTDNRQIFGNIINIHMADSTVDWARLPQTGFMAEHIAEDCYNQISGNDMTAWFNDSTITRLYVEGNVMLNVFPMESDSTYNKFAYVESSYMDAYFSKNEIEKITFWPETTSKITPLYLAKRNSYFLPKFGWYEDLRPRTPGDVFVIPPEMVELFRSAEPIKPEELSISRQTTEPNPKAPAAPEIHSDSITDSIPAPSLPQRIDLDNVISGSRHPADAPIPLPSDKDAPEQPKAPVKAPDPAPLPAPEEENLGAPLD